MNKKQENLRDEHLRRIQKEPGSKGFFIIVANSRSGHNFVKNMVVSWYEDKPQMEHNRIISNQRTIMDLENYLPENWNQLDFVEHPETIISINLRDLLNWLSSASYMKHIQTELIEKAYRDNKIFHRWEVKDKPEMRRDPEVRIIPNQLDKKEYYLLATGQKRRGGSDSPMIERWYKIAKEFVGETNFMPENTIRIYYDGMVESKDYRMEKCKELGGKYTEIALNKLPGVPSSFDGKDYQDKGQEMKVLKRYKQLREDQMYHFKNLAKRRDVLDFYVKHFNPDDDKLRFIDKIMKL